MSNMKIVESRVRRLEITEVQGLDPIRVTLEDLGPGQGRINIECYGQAWAAYWGSMGKETIAQFITTCNEHYIAGKISSTPSRVFDPEGLVEMLKREVIQKRRKGLLYKDEARSHFDKIEDLDLPDNVNAMFHVSGIEELMGGEWWLRVPEKENPEYAYLTKIIRTVQAGLREDLALDKPDEAEKGSTEKYQQQLDKLLTALGMVEEWLSGWASAEPYLTIVRNAVAAVKEG